MTFKQAAIKVEREREFGALKSAIEQAFAAAQIEKYLKKLDSRNVRVRDLDAVLATNALDVASGAKAGTAGSLYQALTVSDQAQMREFYLSKIEEVEPGLRARFSKLYRYY